MKLMALLGLLIGIVELVMAYFSFNVARENEVLRWLKTFGVGVLLLGVGQIACKFLMHGLLGVEQYIGVPFKAAGLSLVLYSVLQGLNYQRLKEAGAFIATVAVVFTLMSYYHLYGDYGLLGKTLFALAHLLFLTVLPFGIAIVTWKVYKESNDPSAFAMTAGLLLYGLATIINMVLYNVVNVPMIYSMSVALVVRLIGVATILGGMLIAIKKPA